MQTARNELLTLHAIACSINIGMMRQQVTINRPYDSSPVHCNNHVSLFKDFNIIAIIKGLRKFARCRASLLRGATSSKSKANGNASRRPKEKDQQ
jgi:hypothetical protein